jgi:hypothetical protein
MNAQAQTRAIKIARTLRLPMTTCKVTKELYGYAYPVLDETQARRAFVSYWTKAHGVHTLDGDITEAALAVMHQRVEILRVNTGVNL